MCKKKYKYNNEDISILKLINSNFVYFLYIKLLCHFLLKKKKKKLKNGLDI